MKESNEVSKIKEWLETQEEDGYSISHKSAMIRSLDPFGLIADYKDENGIIYGYFNGELQTVCKNNTYTRLDKNPRV